MSKRIESRLAAIERRLAALESQLLDDYATSVELTEEGRMVLDLLSLVRDVKPTVQPSNSQSS